LIVGDDLLMDEIVFARVLELAQAGEMSPAVRMGTLDGEFCSTEAIGVLEGIS
jgi:hypothetical protein